MKKILFSIILMLFIIPVMVNAKDITSECKVLVDEGRYKDVLDNNPSTYMEFSKGDRITAECNVNIKYVYIIYNDHSTTGRILFANSENSVGKHGYLHELIKINNNITSFKIAYDSKYELADIYLYDDEALPSDVQDWQTLDSADMVLFSTHSDDEHLFFAGLLPKYVDAGKKIQVAYFTKHTNAKNRYHELLNGLWAAGIKYYPVVSDFPDEWSTTNEGALLNLNAAGFTQEDAVIYETDVIRKYKPYVVVGHDEKGEYGHGQHILNTFILKTAIETAANKNFNLDSINKYGLWEIQKLYLHLYNDKSLCLDYDEPLGSFGGKTAFNVSQDAFRYHLSQQNTWFNPWLYGENDQIKSYKEIKTYNPCKFGLYYSSVGDDEEKNDLFEHVVDTKNGKEIENDTDKEDQIIEIKQNNSSTYLNYLLYFAAVVMIVVITILLVSMVLKK